MYGLDPEPNRKHDIPWYVVVEAVFLTSVLMGLVWAIVDASKQYFCK